MSYHHITVWQWECCYILQTTSVHVTKRGVRYNSRPLISRLCVFCQPLVCLLQYPVKTIHFLSLHYTEQEIEHCARAGMPLAAGVIKTGLIVTQLNKTIQLLPILWWLLQFFLEILHTVFMVLILMYTSYFALLGTHWNGWTVRLLSS